MYLFLPLAVLSMSEQQLVHITGFMDISEPSAEYHFAVSDGSLLAKDKYVGSFVHSGEAILSYKQKSESIIKVSSFSDGYIEKILDTPEVSKGELIVKLKAGTVHGRFKLLDPLNEHLLVENSAFWICNYPEPVQVRVNRATKNEAFVSVDLGEKDYKEIENKKLKLFFEGESCRYAN